MLTLSAIVRPLALSLCVILLAAWSPGAAAQCQGRWLTSPGQTPPGVSGQVQDVAVMPGGELVAAGLFVTTVGTPTNNIARWDGSSWAPLAAGSDGPVFALAVLQDGSLVAGGGFTTIGGVAASNIARWNGSAWSPLAGGMNDWVYALAVQSNGDLIAGGLFTAAGGAASNRVARWDGSSWAPLGSGVDGSALALAPMPDGSLIVGGFFTSAGGAPANHIAQWNGVAWVPLGTGMSSSVRALAVLPSGDLVAGGTFSRAGGEDADRIARWDGFAWTPLERGMSGPHFPSTPFVSALAVTPDGSLIAGGTFSRAGSATATNIARWDGSSWSALGSGTREVGALTVMPSGELIAGNAVGVDRWTDTGVPWIARQPAAQTTAVLGAAAFTVTPASGYDFNGPLTFQWRRNGVPLADGVTPNGTVISGATTNALSLSNLSPLDSGSITAVVGNNCGSATSTAARLTVGSSACPGDANADAQINFNDLALILGNFTAAAPPGTLGDVNGDGIVNFLDLAVVLAAFGSSC